MERVFKLSEKKYMKRHESGFKSVFKLEANNKLGFVSMLKKIITKAFSLMQDLIAT